MKKVSVVIPIFNMEKSLEQCMNKLLKQTYTNIEIILVDDGSTDGSLSLCEKYAEYNSKIRVVHTENRGSGPARNTGIQEATGEFIFFADADDLVELCAVDSLMKAVERTSCDLVVFGYKIMDSKGKVIHTKEYPHAIKTGTEIRNKYEDYWDQTYSIQGAPWNKFFRLSLIKKHKIEYPALRRHQDEVFISRFVEHIETVCFIPDILYCYFSNDLKKVWDKFPKEYLDIVISLRDYRMETIAGWNPQNENVLNIIEREYICNVIRALELSFSKKLNMNKKERKAWIKEAVHKSNLVHTVPKKINMQYQNLVLSNIQSGKYNSLYRLLFLQVFLEKNFSGGIIFAKIFYKYMDLFYSIIN